MLGSLSRSTRYADRGEWLAARATREFPIGASEVSVILGVSPFAGPWDLWTAKMAGAVLEDDEGHAPEVEEDAESEPEIGSPLERGLFWEAHLRALLGRFIGRDVLAPAAPLGHADGMVIVRHPTIPWAQCSPDAWVADGALVDAELKSDASRRGYKWGRSGTEITDYVPGSELVMPPHYYLQKSWQLASIDEDYGYIAVLLGNYRFRWFRVNRCPELLKQITDRVAEWRERHLVRGIEPEPDASAACSAHYRDRYRGTDAGSREPTGREEALIRRLAEGRAMEKDGKQIADGARGALLATMGEHTHLRGPGFGAKRDKAGKVTTYGV